LANNQRELGIKEVTTYRTRQISILHRLRLIARGLDSRGLWLPLFIETHWYDRLDKAPTRFAETFYRLRHGSMGELYLKRRLGALRLNTENLEEDSPPEIELFIACARKDLVTLPLSIKSAITCSRNTISRITLAVPDGDKDLTLETIAGSLDKELVEAVTVKPDSQWFSEELMEEIRSIFGTRFGWFLQQVITAKSVFDSKSPGVLVLDADTILLQPTLFLGSDCRQVIHASSEFNEPYYTYLQTLEARLSVTESHVTHHMLMQPAVLRQALLNLGFNTVESLIADALSYAARSGSKDFSLDYEIYAQFLKLFFPELVEEVKFSNISVGREGDQDRLKSLVIFHSRTKRFKSVSFHDYIGQANE
jgi:hypothetical protein